MDIEKIRLLSESIYWVNMNADTGKKLLKLFYVSWFSANAAKRKDYRPYNTKEAMESHWNRHILTT